MSEVKKEVKKDKPGLLQQVKEIQRVIYDNNDYPKVVVKGKK